jgi:hypothetical protein
MGKERTKQEINRLYIKFYREKHKSDPNLAVKYKTMKEKERLNQQKIRDEKKEKAKNDIKLKEAMRKKET